MVLIFFPLLCGAPKQIVEERQLALRLQKLGVEFIWEGRGRSKSPEFGKRNPSKFRHSEIVFALSCPTREQDQRINTGVFIFRLPSHPPGQITGLVTEAVAAIQITTHTSEQHHQYNNAITLLQKLFIWSRK